jgi:hypothetical protein
VPSAERDSDQPRFREADALFVRTAVGVDVVDHRRSEATWKM